MGVRRMTYYTVECNLCGKLLEDDVGELAGIAIKREDAEDIARDNGWTNNNKNRWICKNCHN